MRPLCTLSCSKPAEDAYKCYRNLSYPLRPAREESFHVFSRCKSWSYHAKLSSSAFIHQTTLLPYGRKAILRESAHRGAGKFPKSSAYSDCKFPYYQEKYSLKCRVQLNQQSIPIWRLKGKDQIRIDELWSSQRKDKTCQTIEHELL